MKQIRSILIVGGGTAALIAALMLKRKLNLQIDVVHSVNMGTIGVGESTTEHWRDFCEFIGINQIEALVECNATYKAGIRFKGWTKNGDWIHHVNAEYSKKWGQYAPVYARQIANNDPYMAPEYYLNDKLPKWLLNKPEIWPTNQFNFDTFKLGEYLTKIATSVGVNFYDDKILDVNLNDQGEISTIKGEKSTYDYDFYFDCTGFQRILMNKLGGEWESYSQYLKTNTAMVFPTGDADNYETSVTAHAMDHGWMFRIPTWGRYGNGYVFDKNHITPDQAKEEVERKLQKEIDVRKIISFDPGHLKSAWIKNCCAIGLSSSFVEPLEATSISTTIQQSFLLMHYLPQYNDSTIKTYNKKFTSLLENIRDFIILHYLVDRKDTEFWKEASSVDLPDSLAYNLEIWKHRLPIYEDFSDLTRYVLFGPDNFTLILAGLNHFDRDSIRKELEVQSPILIKEADRIVQQLKQSDSNNVYMKHKDFIKLTREYYNAT
jgi:tryptophan halogenase